MGSNYPIPPLGSFLRGLMSCDPLPCHDNVLTTTMLTMSININVTPSTTQSLPLLQAIHKLQSTHFSITKISCMFPFVTKTRSGKQWIDITSNMTPMFVVLWLPLLWSFKQEWLQTWVESIRPRYTISVGYHLELLVAMTFYWAYDFIKRILMLTESHSKT